MPNTSGSSRKSNCDNINISADNNNSGSSKNNSMERKARKRKRCEVIQFCDSDFETDLEGCNLEDAISLETNLRKVARKNCLSDEEMRKLVQKFVRNDHVLALVTLQAEDELARERKEAEQPTIVITDTPSMPKLTRAKARELNKTPAITLPPLNEPPQGEFAYLIQEDLQSDDDDDEEYSFKEEDFVSDDDRNTTASDMDSNPRTPQTPLTFTDYEESPVKFTPDGCFKIPLDKRKDTEDLRIATRTRSKFCLQQTTIEDLQSEFVPPDVEQIDVFDSEITTIDDDWMQFLNEFSKPLNNSFTGDDDDPINDPEYVAAEKVKVDAEELRDVNISKKELTELVAELFEGLITEGVSLDNIDLETPQKFLNNNSCFNTDQMSTGKEQSQQITDSQFINDRNQATRQINFEPGQHVQQCNGTMMSTTSLTQVDYSFMPNIMSTPSTNVLRTPATIPQGTLIPLASTIDDLTISPCKTVTLPHAALNSNPELIAIPLPGQPNCFQLAKIVPSTDINQNVSNVMENEVSVNNITQQKEQACTKFSIPYDGNFTWEYVSIRKHVYSEYIDKFEGLRYVTSEVVPPYEHQYESQSLLSTKQFEMLQQQLRIHVQMLTQSFIQTYSHPEYWKLAPKARNMLHELDKKSEEHPAFKIWNLKGAIHLITKWEQDLSMDNDENREMMDFINKEILITNRNTRQIPRFAPRIMNLMLNSNVFMYPQYLPRIPFTPKVLHYHVFSPSESHLIAFGLEKHLGRIRDGIDRISKKASPLLRACEKMSKDTICGKSRRRIWDYIKTLRNQKHYNPVKFYFEHNCAPPIDRTIYTFVNNTVWPPSYRYYELPIVYQKYLNEQNNPSTIHNTSIKRKRTLGLKASEAASCSFAECVREAVGDELQLPDGLDEIIQTSVNPSQPHIEPQITIKSENKENFSNIKDSSSLTVNINYVYNGTSPYTSTNINSSDISFNNTSVSTSNISAANRDLYESFALQNGNPQTSLVQNILNKNSSQKKLTEYFPIKQKQQYQYESKKSHGELQRNLVPSLSKDYHKFAKLKNRYKHLSSYQIGRRNRLAALNYQQKCFLMKHCAKFLSTFQLQVEQESQIHKKSPLVQYFYRRFRALDKYTQLLNELAQVCCKMSTNGTSCTSLTPTTSTTNVQSGQTTNSSNSNKRRVGNGQQPQQNTNLCNDDEIGVSSSSNKSSKKSNRQENFRHMLLPDSPEDSNRKDAIYAFNFYDKVEEVFRNANRPDDCRTFNQILKSFDPKSDKVSDLYQKLEKLFLPDHPELAQVFLTFLLPAEAIEIGKFFEYFMINNMTTFIHKLNVYFHKQPAQIKKIYNCLNELAEDTNVTMKKIEAKILPLLKGNQFLVDWFLQQFPEKAPPERLLPTPEHVNMKEITNNQTGEYIENYTNIMDSPTSDQQPACQLKYINGRIFYGSKMTLPAKLSFMAGSYQEIDDDTEDLYIHHNPCIHGVKHNCEKQDNATGQISENISDLTEKSEEDEATKALIIDTTEEDSCSSIETCDEATLRTHALRLNPSYYSSTCFPPMTSTPNVNHHNQSHNLNAKKSSLHFNDEGKISPRKCTTSANAVAPLSPNGQSCGTLLANTNATCPMNDTPISSCSNYRSRRSPTKKIKSPNSYGMTQKTRVPPMVVIHGQNSAIQCAKKLKTLVENDNESECDSKYHLSPIVARTKSKARESQNINLSNKKDDSGNKEPLLMTLDLTEDSNECNDTVNNSDNDGSDHIDEHDIKCDTIATLADEQSGTTKSVIRTLPNNSNGPISTATTKIKTNSIAAISSLKPNTLLTRGETMTTTPKILEEPWTRDEDKIILIEMKNGTAIREELFSLIHNKLPMRTIEEISNRHQFIMEFVTNYKKK